MDKIKNIFIQSHKTEKNILLLITGAYIILHRRRPLESVVCVFSLLRGVMNNSRHILTISSKIMQMIYFPLKEKKVCKMGE